MQIKYFFLNSGAVYIFGFSNFVLYNVIKDQLVKKDFNHILFLSLLSLLYINTTFPRLSEQNDAATLASVIDGNLY